MQVTEQQVLDALRSVRYPGFTRDIVTAGAVQQLEVAAGTVRFTLVPGPGDPAIAERIEHEARDALLALEGVRSIEIRRAAARSGSESLGMVDAKPSAVAAGALGRGLIPEVRHTVAVASGKGGVGKSTVAVNLAVALARAGTRVGLLDVDVYGPSVPLMMGLQGAQPRWGREGATLLPFERWGVHFMSLGFLVDPGSAVIWRGPLVMKAIEQLLGEVEWGALEVLLLDMPPGTGDAQLTVSQRIRLSGAVIVTTPQDVALADAIKGVAMFRKVNVPILGIVENMSFFRCPHCSERTEIFGYGGGRDQAKRLGVPFLGEIPLEPAIRSSGDSGEPVVNTDPDAPHTAAFVEIAERIRAALDDGADRPADDQP
jgi:ATP-binding protein involved in chromosome partitioning